MCIPPASYIWGVRIMNAYSLVSHFCKLTFRGPCCLQSQLQVITLFTTICWLEFPEQGQSRCSKRVMRQPRLATHIIQEVSLLPNWARRSSRAADCRTNLSIIVHSPPGRVGRVYRHYRERLSGKNVPCGISISSAHRSHSSWSYCH